MPAIPQWGSPPTIGKRAIPIRVVLATVVLLALASACHKWVSLDPPSARTIMGETSGTVRVTLADSSRVVFRSPQVSGDSLFASEDTVAIALNEVRQVEARRTDVLATVGLATGIGVVAFFGFAVAVCVLGACAGI